MGGFKCAPDSAQPLAWRNEDGGQCTAVLLPMPDGSTVGSFIDIDAIVGKFTGIAGCRGQAAEWVARVSVDRQLIVG